MFLRRFISIVRSRGDLLRFWHVSGDWTVRGSRNPRKEARPDDFPAAPLSVSASTRVPGARSTAGDHLRVERH